MKKKVCIFDLDGTLLDTVNTIAYYCNYTLRHFGFPENPPEKYKYFAGDGALNLLHRALGAHNLDNKDNFEKTYPFYIAEYDKDTTYLTSHFEGMPETLRALKDKGITLCVVSNKPVSSVKYVLPLFFDADLFTEIHGSGPNLPVKPDPYFVNEIIKHLGVKREEVLYVGDTSTDMKTGKNANVETVGVLWGFREREELAQSGADHIIEKPQQLLKFFE